MNPNLILNIPHASTWIPEDCFRKDSREYQILQNDHLNMVDWYTDQLFNCGVGIPVIAPVSRMVCDTERFSDPGKESMEKIGMGMCYRTTSDLKHKISISQSHRNNVFVRYYNLHHRNLELAVERARNARGHVFILDCHSFSPVPLPYERDQRKDRPDICIGTDYYHTPGQIDKRAASFFRRRGYRVAMNRPYSGTIVPIKHLYKDRSVFSMMIEVNRGLYLKSGTNEKNDYFPTLQKHLKDFEEYIAERYTGRGVYLGSLKADDPLFQTPVYFSTYKTLGQIKY